MFVADRVLIPRGCWLVAPGFRAGDDEPPRIYIGAGSDLGESCAISAATRVRIGVLLGLVWVI